MGFTKKVKLIMPYINVSQTILRLKNVLFFKDFPYYLFVYLPYVIELYDLVTTHDFFIIMQILIKNSSLWRDQENNDS